MTAKTASKLKRGDMLLIKGTVRKVHETGDWVEVQFPSYSLSIPVSEIECEVRRLPANGTEAAHSSMPEAKANE